MKLEVNAAYDSEVSYFIVSQFGGHEQLCKKSESRDIFSVRNDKETYKDLQSYILIMMGVTSEAETFTFGALG